MQRRQLLSRFALLGTVFALPALPAFAAQAVKIESIDYPAGLTLAGKTLSLNGAALRRKLVFKVYAAGLYTTAPVHTAAEAFAGDDPVRVRLGLLRNVKGADFIEALDDGLRANITPEAEKALAGPLENLRALMRNIGDVHTNDLVDFDYIPGTGTVVLLNGKPSGLPVPGGRALYNAVLAIWLGEHAIDAGVRKGLLAQ